MIIELFMRDKRRFSKPIAMNSLVGGALQRHGIGRQVEAAMVVRRANELFKTILESHIFEDVRVISYQNKNMIVACKHHAAVREATRAANDVRASLQVDFPALQLKNIFCNVRNDYTARYDSTEDANRV